MLAGIIVFIIIFLVPIGVYGLFSKFYGLKEPDKKKSFFAGIVIQKLGTTIGFVALAMLVGSTFNQNWLQYGFIWFIMFAITEIGQSIMSNYTKKEMAAGIISEAMYFPLAAWVVQVLL